MSMEEDDDPYSLPVAAVAKKKRVRTFRKANRNSVLVPTTTNIQYKTEIERLTSKTVCLSQQNAQLAQSNEAKSLKLQELERGLLQERTRAHDIHATNIDLQRAVEKLFGEKEELHNTIRERECDIEQLRDSIECDQEIMATDRSEMQQEIDLLKEQLEAFKRTHVSLEVFRSLQRQMVVLKKSVETRVPSTSSSQTMVSSSTQSSPRMDCDHRKAQLKKVVDGKPSVEIISSCSSSTQSSPRVDFAHCLTSTTEKKKKPAKARTNSPASRTKKSKQTPSSRSVGATADSTSTPVGESPRSKRDEGTAQSESEHHDSTLSTRPKRARPADKPTVESSQNAVISITSSHGSPRVDYEHCPTIKRPAKARTKSPTTRTKKSKQTPSSRSLGATIDSASARMQDKNETNVGESTGTTHDNDNTLTSQASASNQYESTEQNISANHNSTLSARPRRARTAANYAEPRCNRKIRRGDSEWCRDAAPR